MAVACLSQYEDDDSHIDFLSLEYYAETVLTDSVGMQEETTYLNIPCLTLRDNTERPISIEMGTNTLCKTGKEILQTVKKIIEGKTKKARKSPFWDGNTAERITNIFGKAVL